MASITTEELEAIEGILRDRPDGVAMRDLIGEGGSDAQRRAMQRRLRKLIKAGRVTSAGTKKGTRYFRAGVPPTTAFSSPPPTSALEHATSYQEADAGLLIPLSPEGAELQRLVRLPELKREPVGYRREFLSSYQPNVSGYLSSVEREHLARIGSVEGVSTPAGTYARQILDRLLIDLSFNSSRLEGNTYSILDTQALVERGKVAEGKSAEETTMITNHKEAIEFLVEAANEIGFNRHTILNLHALLANDLLDAQSSGRLRHRSVGITNSVYTPLQTPAIIEECFSELLAKAEAIKNPFEQAFFASVQLPYLQPFSDVNKRVSRLAANIPFIKRNLVPVSFIDVPGDLYIEGMLAVYELNRTALARDMFIWAYERSARRYAAIQQSLGAPDQFRLRYREQLRELVSRIVREGLQPSEAALLIGSFASRTVTAPEQARFSEMIETELVGLHEGNFARYGVRPSEFFKWKAAWEAD